LLHLAFKRRGQNEVNPAGAKSTLNPLKLVRLVMMTVEYEYVCWQMSEQTNLTPRVFGPTFTLIVPPLVFQLV